MSRVLPDAIVSRVQKQLGIADSEHLRQELPKMIQDGLQFVTLLGKFSCSFLNHFLKVVFMFLND